MVKMTKTVLLLSGLILAAPVGAGEPLTMGLTPRMAMAPAMLVVRTVIAADKANRALEIVVDSGEFRRSSTIPLAGADAAPVTVTQYRDLPPGNYDVTSELVRADGSRAAVSRQFRVAPSPGYR
jgi:hypothetical protein